MPASVTVRLSEIRDVEEDDALALERVGIETPERLVAAFSADPIALAASVGKSAERLEELVAAVEPFVRGLGSRTIDPRATPLARPDAVVSGFGRWTMRGRPTKIEGKIEMAVIPDGTAILSSKSGRFRVCFESSLGEELVEGFVGRETVCVGEVVGDDFVVSSIRAL